MSITSAFNLEQAIQAIEAQRSILGDQVVDAALAPLREKLASMKSSSQAVSPNVVENQQRRLLTILFADLSGFTAMSETLDAEDVRDTMNALWERLDGIILSNGGKIDKHMGDGVMALWGADEIREDDAERAIRAGLAMQAEVQKFRPVLTTVSGLKMRVGINTGPALLGQIGTRGEVTAMGDTVNLASRLEQACTPGGTLISHDTYRHVRGVFDVEPQSPLDVKGKTEPVQTYLVKGAKPRAFRLTTRGIEGVETRMVGRDAEMYQLQETFKRAFYQKNLQVVSIFGDAGVGKSRLLYEFNTWAELQSIPWWWFKGRAGLSMVNAPYALLRDIFAFRFEINETDSLAVAHRKMESGFRQFMPGDEHVIEKAHVIGHLIGFNFIDSPYLRGLLNDPRQLRQQALFYLTQFFSVAASDSPVLMMIDDLQWADAGSLEALMYLLANLPENTPFFALTVSRPSLFERYPKWAQGLYSYAAINLSPLSKDDSRRLVDEILRKVPDLPTAVRELVVGGAEGNPFYVEELIKMLIDARVIQPGDDVWTVEPGRLATVNIPTTLTEVLQARLDGLEPVERFTLQLASVVGRIFWDEAILPLIDKNLTEHQVHEAINNLRRKELIYERRPSSFYGTNEYTFKHSLLYEVTYDTLLKRQRSQYHLRVADWLERVSGERRAEYIGQIAEHYEKGGDITRASLLLSELAEKSLALSALNEAQEFFQRALNLMRSPDKPAREVIMMELGLAGTCQKLGDYPGARVHAENAAAMATDLKIDELVAEALVTISETLSMQGNYKDARSYLLGALYLAREQDKKPVVAHVLTALATVEWRLGTMRLARDYAMEGLTLAREIDDTNTVMMALNRLGVLSMALGFPQQAEEYYDQCYTLAVSVGNRERTAAALNNLATLALERNELEKSINYYHEALEISKETGAQQGIALHNINLGLAYTYLKKFDDAEVFLRDGMRLARQIGAIPVLVAGVTYYGLLAHARGDTWRGLELFGAARSSPASDSENETEINTFLETWDFDPNIIDEGLERGVRLGFERALEQLISD